MKEEEDSFWQTVIVMKILDTKSLSGKKVHSLSEERIWILWLCFPVVCHRHQFFHLSVYEGELRAFPTIVKNYSKNHLGTHDFNKLKVYFKILDGNQHELYLLFFTRARGFWEAQLMLETRTRFWFAKEGRQGTFSSRNWNNTQVCSWLK